MKIKAVIFDMDGVLTESMQYHIASWNYAFNKFNIFPTNEDLAMLEGMSYKETIDRIAKQYAVDLDAAKKQKIYSIKKKRLSEIFEYNVYPHAIEILEFLKNNNIKLALVSGANRKFVNNVISKLFPNFFDVIISGSDVAKGKPDPESFLKALEKIDSDAKNVLVIENSPLGIESAKEANLKTYALTTTLDNRFLEKADKIFNSHEELLLELKKEVGD